MNADNMNQPHYRSFSYRLGLKNENRLPQVDSISSELRNSLWNVLHESFLFDYVDKNLPHHNIYNDKGIEHFFYLYWRDNLKLPLDDFLEELTFDKQKEIVRKFRSFYFEKFQWYEVYDFLEFILIFFDCKNLIQKINSILERELSGWRFVCGCFTQITSQQEILMLEESLNNNDEFQAVTTHLSQALQLMSDKKNPDYRNSIKESISAVESICKIITSKENATLGAALHTIEKSHHIHPALRESFSKLYGYTCQESGIRHAMLDEPNLSVDEAKFFLLSCTSFINYLKVKM